LLIQDLDAIFVLYIPTIKRHSQDIAVRTLPFVNLLHRSAARSWQGGSGMGGQGVRGISLLSGSAGEEALSRILPENRAAKSITISD
jgi:hypothetical protein